jgi:hypothetical protein
LTTTKSFVLLSSKAGFVAREFLDNSPAENDFWY